MNQKQKDMLCKEVKKVATRHEAKLNELKAQSAVPYPTVKEVVDSGKVKLICGAEAIKIITKMKNYGGEGKTVDSPGSVDVEELLPGLKKIQEEVDRKNEQIERDFTKRAQQIDSEAAKVIRSIQFGDSEEALKILEKFESMTF